MEPKQPIEIDGVTFEWSEEHGHWRAGELVLRYSEGLWQCRTFGRFGEESEAKSPNSAVSLARMTDPDFNAEFERLKSAAEQPPTPTLPTPAELFATRPERFEAFGFVWRDDGCKYAASHCWNSGPFGGVFLQVFRDGECVIESNEPGSPDLTSLQFDYEATSLQSAYDAAVGAGVDFSSCERVGAGEATQVNGADHRHPSAPAKESDELCPACSRPFSDPYVIRAGHCNSCVECSTVFTHRKPSKALTVDTPPQPRPIATGAAKWHVDNTSVTSSPGWEE
jgi:hypothetical protein